jgi:hypothetical protein
MFKGSSHITMVSFVTNMFDNLTWPSDSPTEENLKKVNTLQTQTLEER